MKEHVPELTFNSYSSTGDLNGAEITLRGEKESTYSASGHRQSFEGDLLQFDQAQTIDKGHGRIEN